MRFVPSAKICRSLLAIATMLAAIALMTSVLSLPSCGNTPARNAYITVEGATTAVQSINDAAKLDASFKKQLPVMAPYVDAVYKAQNDLDAAIASKSVTVGTYAQALTDAVMNLLNEKAKVSAAASAPATSP